MKSSRAFTIVELIFVIIILGILAAVGVLKLAATRDDAAATQALANYKNALVNIQSYAIAQNGLPASLSTATPASSITLRDGVQASGNDVLIRAGGSTCITITRAGDSNITITETTTTVPCDLVTNFTVAGTINVGGAVVIR